VQLELRNKEAVERELSARMAVVTRRIAICGRGLAFDD